MSSGTRANIVSRTLLAASYPSNDERFSCSRLLVPGESEPDRVGVSDYEPTCSSRRARVCHAGSARAPLDPVPERFQTGTDLVQTPGGGELVVVVPQYMMKPSNPALVMCSR